MMIVEDTEDANIGNNEDNNDGEILDDGSSSEDITTSMYKTVCYQMESNDPTLTELDVGPSEVAGWTPAHTLQVIQPDDGDWGAYGTAIGRNTSLRKLKCWNFHAIGLECIRSFLLGFALNRSIQQLSFYNCDLSVFDDSWTMLIPFFVHNISFERLEVRNSSPYIGSDVNLCTVLRNFDSLKEFYYSDVHNFGLVPVNRDGIVEALVGHISLKKLDLHNQIFGRGGCAALATILLNPICNLEALCLHSIELDDNGACVIARGLSGVITLRELMICHGWITENGWHAIFAALQRSRCRLEELYLWGISFNEAIVLSLSNALQTQITTLKSLVLSSCFDERNYSIAGWTALLPRLQEPSCELEKLDLSGNYFTDEMIGALTNALVSNSSLRELKLTNVFEEVTAEGWETLSSILRNPNSALRILDLRYCLINDQVAIHFAHALVNNTMLQVLDLVENCEDEDEDIRDYAAFVQMLCDNSTILSTYQSNHTLERLSGDDLYGNCYESDLPVDVLSLLQINRENSVSQAARLKIINTHFSGVEINMLPFVEMNLSVRPRAVAWMAKDMHLYDLLRAMPSLLERVDENVRSTKRLRS
jgi:Ran GTPase-activating protein (RanGAP) involved in mRNA processing and transport